MHPANHYYGHPQIMAGYAGLSDWRHPPRIWGYLQHGWNVHHGFDPGAHLVAGVPKLVWSPRPAETGRNLGLRDYHVVGAPWVYLLALEPRLGAVADGRRRGTIVYPFHGWERQAVIGDHRRLAETIRDHEEGPVTCCLYWLEYRTPEVRRVYKRAGFRVITHGRRGRRGTADPGFLYRQLAELRAHRRVVSNRLSTAVLYGASVGCEVGVYGDPMVLVDDDRTVPGGADRVRAEWAEMHAVTVPADAAEKIAAEELGIEHRRTPRQIAELLGWRGTGPSPQCADLPAQLRWLDQTVQQRDDELRRVRASTSYRVGNALVRPARRLGDRLGRMGGTR